MAQTNVGKIAISKTILKHRDMDLSLELRKQLQVKRMNHTTGKVKMF